MLLLVGKYLSGYTLGAGDERDLDGLFPCGEGAGYAGGIVSSALDGRRCAEAVYGY